VSWSNIDIPASNSEIEIIGRSESFLSERRKKHFVDLSIIPIAEKRGVGIR